MAFSRASLEPYESLNRPGLNRALMQVLSMHDPANGIVCLPNCVDHDQLRVFYKVRSLPALLVQKYKH
jgi:hypothetical protein